nr:leucine-rich repeat-containing protein 72 isoform X2 [Chrysemys picta bellii]XP_023962339.1 leucine-rich repeat-containing protein 72 isoform X2 [Chrysemys picta bellii]XP_042712527.1 leucine-rich repeat-containing protein 72 isoform X2 [Chrysemys picta bellii]XP_042712534.1 leucine-rich repeat-containing protein 72 isoform X2 [Chrysemys picta bellii]XP_042712538.1 leucine-rich repeat-containing protein 72 isoform X2 [Chrysemys picta bellii]
MDVSVLYLAGQGLKEVPNLSRFQTLRYLWLNNNKIQKLTFLINNYRLTELYLNNNELTDIAGALKHLHALQILLLHNNQLKNLDTTVKELKGMISLQTLNLFHNPLSQDPGYRLYVTYFLSSVQHLDRKKVTQKERESALHIYNHERSRVLQSIGFGKRIDMPLVTKTVSTRCTPFAKSLLLSPGYEVANHINKVPFENPEDAVFVRAMKRSIMEFSSVDWNKIPTCLGICLENKPEEPHEKLTVKFR